MFLRKHVFESCFISIQNFQTKADLKLKLSTKPETHKYEPYEISLKFCRLFETERAVL